MLYKDTCSFLFELKSLGLPSGVTGWLGVSPGGRLGLPSGVAGWLGVPSGVTGWLGLPSGVAGWLGVPSGVAGWLGLPSGVAGWLRLASGGLAGLLALTSEVHREPSTQTHYTDACALLDIRHNVLAFRLEPAMQCRLVEKRYRRLQALME